MKKKGFCGICPDKCPIVATIEEGKIVKVEGDKDHPGGRVCPRGALTPQIVYSERRIKKPLIRDGEKGSGKFREASWEEALNVAAEGFLKIKEQYGPDALVSYLGSSGREDASMRCFMGPNEFFKHLGSHNDMTCGCTCNFSSNMLTPVLTYGVPTPKLYQDIPNSEIVFIWGKNSKTDSGPLTTLQLVKAAKERGAQIIVIDPRGEGMAELADLWIPIIPGADGALVMAMLKLIVEEERYDKAFVKDYTKGFDEFAEYLKTITVEEMSGYCGVSVEMIHKLVDIFCSTTKISLVSYTGLEYQLSGIQNNRAIQTMWAITGKVDVPGGICIATEKNPTVPLRPMEAVEQAVGAKEYPLFSRLSGSGQFVKLPDAVLNDDPYPVRGMLICAASPSITYPDQDLWEEIYKKLDCLVVFERFMSNDCKYADVIFPATTYYENQSVVSVPGGMRLRNRFIEPVGEAKCDVFIFQALAEKMGFGDAYPKNDEELMLWMCNGDAQLLEKLKENEYGVVNKPQIGYEKYKTGALRADGQPGFPTPSGKFEISSTYIAECGYTPYPKYEDIRTIKEMGSEEEYPLIMTTAARSALRFCSFGPNLKEIADREPLPTVDMNEEDAKTYGVADGETVIVETAFGKGEFDVRICPMAKGSIHIAGGAGSFYMEGEWKSHNVNKLCSMKYTDPLCGFLTHKSVPSKVVKKN